MWLGEVVASPPHRSCAAKEDHLRGRRRKERKEQSRLLDVTFPSSGRALNTRGSLHARARTGQFVLTRDLSERCAFDAHRGTGHPDVVEPLTGLQTYGMTIRRGGVPIH